jgi:hypothetical protein
LRGGEIPGFSSRESDEEFSGFKPPLSGKASIQLATVLFPEIRL